QKAAWLFMQWATAKEQVVGVQSEKGVLGGRDSLWKDPKGLTKVPADLRESLTVGSKVGTPLWNPPVVAVAECRDAIGAAIVVSIQGGDVRAADNKAAADVRRIMAETEKKEPSRCVLSAPGGLASSSATRCRSSPAPPSWPSPSSWPFPWPIRST